MNLQKPLRYDFKANDLYTNLESQLTNDQIVKYGNVYLQLRMDLNNPLHSQLIVELQLLIRNGILSDNK